MKEARKIKGHKKTFPDFHVVFVPLGRKRSPPLTVPKMQTNNTCADLPMFTYHIHEQPSHHESTDKIARVNMISMPIKLLPTLIKLLNTTNSIQVGEKVRQGANTFRPSPAQNSGASCDFAQVLEMQKVYNSHRATEVPESANKSELYKQWNAKIIEMMEWYDARQKCQNCHQTHKCLATAIEWIKWHRLLLGLKVESMDKGSFNVMMCLAKIIELGYQQSVKGTACRKSREGTEEKSQEVSAAKEEETQMEEGRSQELSVENAEGTQMGECKPQAVTTGEV